MIKTVFIWIFWFFIITLVIYWIWTGGIGKVMNSFRPGDTFGTESGNGIAKKSFLRLPWQPSFSALSADSPGNAKTSALDNQYATLEGQYEQLNLQANEAKVFGDPSPEKGQVRITETYGVVESNAAREYLVLTANANNTAPVELKGWSLQSAYTGMRAYIPLSASSFTMGILNDQENVLLYPGASAIVSSGGSPVGTSFRENMCSGYLGQLQDYYPPLPNSCPPAYGALLLTPDNLKVYGEACFDFLETIPPCTAPLQNIPSTGESADFVAWPAGINSIGPNSVNPNCRAFAANIFSYNGCVASNRFRPAFNSNAWRLYLGANIELWRNTHDIIRLLDGEGRTVDVVTY
ncbi:MAG: hypothetical protein AAB899_03560 [Patescibacteria group bacterium]